MAEDIKTRIYERSPDMVSRSIEGETILVPMVRSGDEVDSIYTLNETARFVWDRLDGVKTVESILAELEEEYEGDPGEIAESVAEFLLDLASIKGVVEKS